MGGGGRAPGRPRVRKRIRETLHYCDNAGHTHTRWGSGTANRWRGVSLFNHDVASKRSFDTSVSTVASPVMPSASTTSTYATDYNPYLK